MYAFRMDKIRQYSKIENTLESNMLLRESSTNIFILLSSLFQTADKTKLRKDLSHRDGCFDY